MKELQPERKIIQVWHTENNYSESTDYGLRDFTDIEHYCLCNDGTIWTWMYQKGWRQCFGPIPKTDSEEKPIEKKQRKDARILELLQENANLKKKIEILFLEIEGLKLEFGI